MPITHRISPTQIRQLILEESARAGVGHIGSALSVVEILTTLYGGTLDIPNPGSAERDRFVLSKGHAALALYAVLHLRGWISRAELATYCATPTRLGVHPEHIIPGVDFSTGSLGHGLSMGAGAALAARLQGSGRRAFVVVSDAECNEGALWEAVMFAAHHRLSNLVALVDANGQQALGRTCDVLDLTALATRWRAFGWEAVEADGHDVAAMTRALAGFDRHAGPPHVLIAHTVCGKGVSYMEHQVKWHYWPMSAAEYEQALREIREEARP